MPDVVVAVLTYRRNHLLKATLPLLVEQVKFVSDTAYVLVVDNDPSGGAEPIVAAASGPVRYVHEPTPGIAAGRNRAMDEVGKDVLLVFIDDDERPDQKWLCQLVAAWEQFGTAAVTGPVISEFAEPGLDAWLQAGNFFAQQLHTTGDEVVAAATNNLLLNMSVIAALGLRFDGRFGLTGGSDTLFTRQLIEAGQAIVWAADAVVYDLVPIERMGKKWALLRWFRSGNTWSRTSVCMADTTTAKIKSRAEDAWRGVIRAVAGSAKCLLGSLLGRAALSADGARMAMRGAGMTSGAFGYVYSEYRRDKATKATRRERPKIAQ